MKGFLWHKPSHGSSRIQSKFIEIIHQDHSMQHNYIKTTSNGWMIPHTLVLQAEIARMQLRDSDSQWSTKGTALELLPSTLTHTQEQGLKGGYASIKRTLILLVKIRLGNEEQNNFVFPFCNALMAEPIEEVREWCFSSFSLRYIRLELEKKNGTALKKILSRFYKWMAEFMCQP